MSDKPAKRLVREGEFVAEVDVTLVEGEGGWAPICHWRTRAGSTTCVTC